LEKKGQSWNHLNNGKVALGRSAKKTKKQKKGVRKKAWWAVGWWIVRGTV